MAAARFLVSMRGDQGPHSCNVSIVVVDNHLCVTYVILTVPVLPGFPC
jgi:hypothetical protein